MIRNISQEIVARTDRVYNAEHHITMSGKNVQLEINIDGKYRSENVPRDRYHAAIRRALKTGQAPLTDGHGTPHFILKIDEEEHRLILPHRTKTEFGTRFEIARHTTKETPDAWTENRYNLEAGPEGLTAARYRLVDEEHQPQESTRWEARLKIDCLEELVSLMNTAGHAEVVGHTVVQKQVSGKAPNNYTHQVRIKIGTDYGLELDIDKR